VEIKADVPGDYVLCGRRLRGVAQAARLDLEGVRDSFHPVRTPGDGDADRALWKVPSLNGAER
jgi:hypothetical protein